MKLNKKALDKRRRKIRAVLLRRGIASRKIADDLGVNPSLIANVIAGRKTSRKVIEALIKAGVPESYFREAGNGTDGK